MPIENLFQLNEAGEVTEIRGVPEGHVIAVLTEQERIEVPSRSTSWALSAAYEFAEQLPKEDGEAAMLDVLKAEYQK